MIDKKDKKRLKITDEQEIQIMMKVLGVDEITARFIAAIENEEIDGDVIEVEK